MMASAGSAHEGVGGEAEEAAEACTLNSLPEDVVIEHVLLLLPLPLIGLVARCTKRLSKLTQNPELWERLFLREMGENCSELTAASDWKSACLQLTSLRRMRWERVRKEDGAWPPARWGHTVTVLSRDRLMVFGGECNGPANDVHVLDVRETGCEWQLKRCSGVYPEARFGHSCVVNQGTAVIFGGSNGDTYFDDLQCLDVQSWRWWTPQTRGTPPSPRSSHSTTLCRNQAFVFGGIGVCGQQPNECLHDLVILDLETWCWSHPQVFGNVPQKRFVHRMVAIEEKLLLFGGRTSQAEKFNDLHWLDLQTMAWSKVEGVEGVPPSTRGGCTLVAIGNKAVMFGGRAEKDICLFDGVFLLHAHENPLRWHKASPSFSCPTPPLPPALLRFFLLPHSSSSSCPTLFPPPALLLCILFLVLQSWMGWRVRAAEAETGAGRCKWRQSTTSLPHEAPTGSGTWTARSVSSEGTARRSTMEARGMRKCLWTI